MSDKNVDWTGGPLDLYFNALRIELFISESILVTSLVNNACIKSQSRSEKWGIKK